MFELIYPGWLAGILLSFATGPLGSFIIWRRISSFGDTLSHSSILGLAISILFKIDSFYTVLFFMSFLAIVLAWIEKLLSVSLETILSIISYSSLSLGMIFISLMSTSRHIDLSNYLFGDLLIVTKFDLFIISLGSLTVLTVLFLRWNSILLLTINEELAQIDGVNIFYARLTLMLTTALAISIAIKFVGVLLITSLLIIPPATAQLFSDSPEKMIIISIIISIISVTGGIFLSFFYNTPTSPSIVLFSSCVYLLSNVKKFL
ncbi:zinc ABC transporter permease subunit ZnuB [Buchnera aphidicola]|uniref:High-affinity zinc uptake system membrane protein ZnuB n=1 Tax=Buchnera aphidicola subsp. Rhopalosiphum maidis TaxID=118109 RepID=A0A3G2I5R0_BUCRM|nr:zinc ABC transporter permease subunit ZnuB [Buchnera aphidicola]AYN24750.1 zinc ABC transporter permease subunit ZnuB [Buchnera aphidicola (Rhopalosiphum maidis)]